MAAYGGPLMELIRLPSAHRIFFRASVYEASPGARFARATGRRIKRQITTSMNIIEPHHVKPKLLFPTWSDTNQAVQLWKMATGLKFWI